MIENGRWKGKVEEKQVGQREEVRKSYKWELETPWPDPSPRFRERKGKKEVGHWGHPNLYREGEKCISGHPEIWRSEVTQDWRSFLSQFFFKFFFFLCIVLWLPASIAPSPPARPVLKYMFLISGDLAWPWKKLFLAAVHARVSSHIYELVLFFLNNFLKEFFTRWTWWIGRIRAGECLWNDFPEWKNRARDSRWGWHAEKRRTTGFWGFQLSGLGVARFRRPRNARTSWPWNLNVSSTRFQCCIFLQEAVKQVQLHSDSSMVYKIYYMILKVLEDKELLRLNPRLAPGDRRPSKLTWRTWRCW